MRGELLEVSAVPDLLRDAMYRLMCGQFVGVDRGQFEIDLEEKNWVVLLREGGSGTLRGFSTLHVYRHADERAALGVVYSGDTVVDGGAGMGSSLSKIWIGAVQAIRARMGLDRLVWLLLTSGYRTYRFLPMYWLDFYPRYDADTPPRVRDLTTTLACERFGPAFDRVSGVVRFEHPHVLRPGLGGIPAHRLEDPHVAFFARANPGHERGDELVCFTELSETNLTSAGKRMWSAGRGLFPADVEP